MKKISTLLLCLLTGFSVWAQNLPVVDFTGFTGSNLSTAFPGWSEGEGIAAPTGTSSGWTDGNFANDAAFGRGARINLYNANDDDWIVSPSFTVQNTASLEYDIAMTGFLNTSTATMGSDDLFQVRVSTDGGANFSVLRSYSDTSVVSNTGQHEIISLDQFVGQTIILGFYGSEGTVDDPEDYDVHLDNLEIINPAAIDLEMVEITSPLGAACYSAAEEVIVVVKNVGLQPIDFGTNNTPVVLAITGPAPATASTMISSGMLMPNASLSVTVTNSADLSVAGPYELQAYASYPGDLASSNDSASANVIAVPTLTGPATEDFETFVDDGNFSGNGTGLANGWTNDPTGPTTDFNWSVRNGSTASSNTGPDQDHTTGSGVYMYTESSRGSTDDQTTLLSPCISIDGLTAPGMAFWYHMYGATIGTLEVYMIDAAGTETMVFTATGAQQSSGAAPWVQSVTNLIGVSGPVQFKFVGSKGSSSTGDIAIDDFRVFELPTIDMEMTEIVSPVGTTCFGENETVAVKITNKGLLPMDFSTDNVTIAFDIDGTPAFTTVVNSGTLAIDSSQIVTVSTMADFSTPNTYALTASLSVAGDGSFLNDTINASIISLPVLVAPLQEDFETFVDDGGFSGNGTGLMNGWTNDPTGPTTSYNWSVNSGGSTGSSSTGPDGDHTTGSGTYMYSESSNGSTGDQATFLSPCLDLSSVPNPGLSFWYHMYGSTIGTLEVYVLDATGAETMVFSATGAQQSAGSDDWLESISNLTGVTGPIQVKFVATKGSSSTGDISIDDIQIYELPAVNMEMTQISSPSPVLCANNNETISVEITNKGLFAMDFSTDSVEIVVEVDGTPTYNTTLNTGSLGVDTTQTVVVATGADFSDPGTRTLRAYLTTAQDPVQENDTTSITVQSIASVSSFPYAEDFEAGAGSWTTNGTNNSWEIGVPANTIIDTAASGSNAWVTSLEGSYNSNENSEVLSPCLDLTNAPIGTVVALSVWWESEDSYDGAVLQSSIDLGATWQNVGADGDPNNWYNDGTINGEPGGQQEGWTGDDGDGSNGWVRASHELDSSLVGQSQVLFRVAFGSDGSVVREGFAFDYFVLATVPTVSLGDDGVYCPGATLDAGNPGASYLWSNGATTQSIVLENTTGAAILDSSIAVTVTDSLGFMVSDTIVVSITTGAPMVTIDPIKDFVCFGDSTGAAMLSSMGGSGMVTYSWDTDPVQMTDSITGLPAGMYIVTATDTAGCSSTDTLTISSNPEITVALDTIVGVACNIDTTGSISITAAGGTGPLSFMWSNGDTTEDISGLMPGDYTGMITDSLGCSISATLTVPATPGDPVASFTYEMSGSIIGFTNTSTGTNDSTTYAWDFGDGASDSIASPAHYYNSNDTFIVSLTVTNQCGSSTATDTINITTVGIEDDLLNKVTVFPNPTKGEFEVEFEGLNLEEVSLSVISIEGKKVHTQQIGRVNGNFSERLSLPATLARGVYVIQIQTKEAVVYKRIRLE